MDFNLTDEQIMVRDSIRDFAKQRLAPLAEKADQEGVMDVEIIKELAELGYCGICIPSEYGGAGFDTLCYALAIEEVSKADASVGVMLSVTNSPAQLPILDFGSELLKKTYLPKLASGSSIGAFCLSEANAGSDAASIKTSADLNGDYYRLNGRKQFVTNGGIADIFIVFAVTDKSAGAKGISAFVVEKNFPGFRIGKIENKMGLKASSTAEVILEDCRVPKQNLIGEPGQGYKIALATLDHSRIGIAAQALGIAEAAFEQALEYSKQRVQFGRPICQFQAIQFMLSDMATEIEAARYLVYHAAWRYDQKQRVSKEASMAKLFASEMAFRVVHKALQIHGGYGYMKEYPIERMYRDQRVTEIYEGTSEVQRIVIANQLLK
ncbi:MAG: acyl-CoA dehydrogenase [candidate division KSB1 bacterium]|nr:acyl-CoA dehydrogenase [candidate division KSB1 bacterium]MDZ7376286.1 acyl-CoA dehydrogenase [candidate division KSB1 bacterium]MDZ7399239.1 acyl-CoA dehydrogenase [candidate division KSB1 bacterium]